MSVITNLKVYNFDNAVKQSKYPMATDVNNVNSDIVKRTQQLASCPKGEGHDNFLKGIVVAFDLTFTIKAWTEAERYHWLDIVSSQSTMHKIEKMDIDKNCIEYVDKDIIASVKKLIKQYVENPTRENRLKLLYSVPVGLKLTAGIVTNYQQLKTIYSQRKNHRLPEWQEFCQTIRKLPYFEELILGKKVGGAIEKEHLSDYWC